MNRSLFLGLTACLALAALAPVSAAPYAENFSAPAKADGTIPGWKTSPGFSLTPGALLFDGTPAKSFATWTVPPVGTTVTYTVNVTPAETPGTEWDVVGIGIMTDPKNYWHLALVQSPVADKAFHFAELSEMYNNDWNAQGKSLTIESPVGGFVWKTGVTYLFKVVVSPTQIEGTISEAGVVKFDRICKFTAPAVTKGQLFVDSAGIKAKFTDLHAEVTP